MNILDEIAEKRIKAVEKLRLAKPFEEVKRQAEGLAKEEYERNGGFAYIFKKNISREGINFICEVKKASPSKGVIAEDFPYMDIAKDYEAAGAAAISVLTEPEYFLGRDEYLSEIAKNVEIPVLRKDFVVDEYQIYEAKLLGASAVLLICTLLSDKQLKEYKDIADRLGLSALVEAHDEEEVRRAINAGADIIGVNNRDLKTFTVDINNSVNLRKLIPEHIVFVSESGIRTACDIKRLKENNTNAVLIGETFMRSTDKKQMLKELLGE